MLKHIPRVNGTGHRTLAESRREMLFAFLLRQNVETKTNEID
jgi:hypothetical protein